MGNVWVLAALWVGLALIATLLAIWFKISTALTEIVVGVLAQMVLGKYFGGNILGAKTEWITFLAGTGAVVLTFLAGAELDPAVLRTKWKETTVVGLVGFFAPFLGCAAVAHYLLGWSTRSSWLAGVALSTTSVAVVYAVMLELGFNVTEFGKSILASCFINDLATVIALGLIFSPFTVRTVIFVAASIVIAVVLPFVTPRFFRKYGGRVSELEAKYILLLLFTMGALAVWAGSEAVLPAYVIGMVLAGTVGRDHALVRRLRTRTFGLLTPFYVIRAGSFVSVPTLYTLMMSTGLTFGTISALFGINHGVIDQAQYSHLVATVIGSAVIPTVIANALFMPRHLLPNKETESAPDARVNTAPAEEENDRQTARCLPQNHGRL